MKRGVETLRSWEPVWKGEGWVYPTGVAELRKEKGHSDCFFVLQWQPLSLTSWIARQAWTTSLVISLVWAQSRASPASGFEEKGFYAWEYTSCCGLTSVLGRNKSLESSAFDAAMLETESRCCDHRVWNLTKAASPGNHVFKGHCLDSKVSAHGWRNQHAAWLNLWAAVTTAFTLCRSSWRAEWK